MAENQTGPTGPMGPEWKPASLKCPHCYQQITATASLQPRPGAGPWDKPDDGALLLCSTCCELSVVINTGLLGLTLRILSEPELAAVQATFGDITSRARQMQRQLRDEEER